MDLMTTCWWKGSLVVPTENATLTFPLCSTKPFSVFQLIVLVFEFHKFTLFWLSLTALISAVFSHGRQPFTAGKNALNTTCPAPNWETDISLAVGEQNRAKSRMLKLHSSGRLQMNATAAMLVSILIWFLVSQYVRHINLKSDASVVSTARFCCSQS